MDESSPARGGWGWRRPKQQAALGSERISPGPVRTDPRQLDRVCTAGYRFIVPAPQSDTLCGYLIIRGEVWCRAGREREDLCVARTKVHCRYLHSPWMYEVATVIKEPTLGCVYR